MTAQKSRARLRFSNGTSGGGANAAGQPGTQALSRERRVGSAGACSVAGPFASFSARGRRRASARRGRGRKPIGWLLASALH